MLNIHETLPKDSVAMFMKDYAFWITSIRTLTIVWKRKVNKNQNYSKGKKGNASFMLQSFTEQSSLPLANFIGSTREKSTDQALFSCSLWWETTSPVPASHIWDHPQNFARNIRKQSLKCLFLASITFNGFEVIKFI